MSFWKHRHGICMTHVVRTVTPRGRRRMHHAVAALER
jgi:hypothetical protein